MFEQIYWIKLGFCYNNWRLQHLISLIEFQKCAAGEITWWRKMHFHCKCVLISAIKLLKQWGTLIDIYEANCQGSNVGVTNFWTSIFLTKANARLLSSHDWLFRGKVTTQDNTQIDCQWDMCVFLWKIMWVSQKKKKIQFKKKNNSVIIV